MEFDQLMQLIDTVSRSELNHFSYEEGETKIKLGKNPRKAAAAAKAAETSENGGAQPLTEEASEQVQRISSPLVGVFYAAPSEEAIPFVAVGDTVKKGQTLGIVEAMKLMNEIEAECDGVIKEIAVKNGEVVEYGQTLFVLSVGPERSA